MSEIDKNIIEYDISNLKKNIKNLMKEKHITQTSLANKAGMDQSRISAILNGKSSDCFTVPQLVYIARALNVSTDTLLGLDEPKEPEHELCMSDICSKLFELDNMVNLKIGACRTGEYREIDSFAHEAEEIEVPGIYFGSQALSDFLKEWNEIISSNIGRKETKAKVLELWKTETLKDASKRKAKWNYRTEQEEAERLLKSLIDAYEDYNRYNMQEFPGYWLRSELNLVEKYLENTPFTFDTTREEAYMALDIARNSFKTLPDDIDDKLPFD